MPSCSPAHSCTEIGYPALIKITVQTDDCTNCNTANEGGLQLVLEDNTALTCSSGQLDNKEKTDYNNGMLAEFLAAEEDGLDGCENVSRARCVSFYNTSSPPGQFELPCDKWNSQVDRRRHLDEGRRQASLLLLLRPIQRVLHDP